MATFDEVLDFTLENDAFALSMISDQRCVQRFTVALFYGKLICFIFISSRHPLNEHPDRYIKRKVVKLSVKENQ